MIKFLSENLTVKNIFFFALITQTIFFIFFAYAGRNAWLYADNTFYETPAWNLASGNRLSIDRSEWEDPYLTNLYYTQHPEESNNEFIPAATLPIGYSIFLAGVYSVFGRNLLAAIVSNLLLLYGFFAAIFILSKRLFADGLQNKILWVLVAVFPFWAYWSSKVMSDVLHVTLMSLFFLFFFGNKKNLPIIAGIFFGLACLVRPYPMLLPLFLLAGGFLFKNKFLSVKRVAVIAAIGWLFLGGWMMRNYYWFGKPMMTSMGPGYGLWLASHRDLIHDYTDDNWVKKERMNLGIRDEHYVEDNAKLFSIALERIKENPVRYFLTSAANSIRTWVSLGGETTPLAGKLLIGGYLIFMFISMLYGAWLAFKAKNGVLIGFVIIAFYYTFIFSWLTVEGRYMLPVRILGFILSSVALAHFAKRFFIRENDSDLTVESIG